MVTEKYLLRSAAEWQGRQEALGILDEILSALRAGDVAGHRRRPPRAIFSSPIQTIIPWASNHFTETLIERVRAEFGAGLLGLLDAGRNVRRWHGLHLRAGAESRGPATPAGDHERRRSANCSMRCPFAMEPVVYDFAINDRGTFADLLEAAPTR